MMKDDQNTKIAEARKIRDMATVGRKKKSDGEDEEVVMSPAKKKQKRRNNSATFVDILKQSEVEEQSIMKDELTHRHEVDKRRSDLEEKRLEMGKKCFELETSGLEVAPETRRRKIDSQTAMEKAMVAVSKAITKSNVDK